MSVRTHTARWLARWLRTANGQGRRATALRAHEIEALVAMAAGTSITELTVELDGTRVTIVNARPADGDAAPRASEAPAWNYAVCALAVGVVRWPDGRAPEPGAAVAAGAPVAYVDALGVREPVRAPAAGEIAGRLVEEGEAVEYGQPLVVLRVRMR